MRYKAFTKYSEDCPVEWVWSDEYEILVDMKEKKVVCFLGEPEDRTFNRDARTLVEMLNTQDYNIHHLMRELNSSY